jgi:starch phosphorylase
LALLLPLDRAGLPSAPDSQVTGRRPPVARQRESYDDQREWGGIGGMTPAPEVLNALRQQCGCGSVQLIGVSDALYERHLLFDNVVDPATAGPRERYEALARSVRDILSQRWVRTHQTYERENPKRVYCLSMEFLIGRSLTNNIANLLLSPFVSETTSLTTREWLGALEEEPDAALGNGGLGRLAACFLDSMATMQLPAMGYGLRYESGMFRQSLENGWQREQPDNWLRRTDPWEVARPDDKVEIRLNCSFETRKGELQPILGRSSTLIGLPFDRPVVGYGGKTINTLRLWAARAPESFDFQAFSHGEFVSAVAEGLAAESLTRVLYPDEPTTRGQALRFVQEYFLVACSLTDLVRRFRRTNDDWDAFPRKVAVQLNDTHPAIAVAELLRILLDEAHLEWDRAWDLTRRTLAYTNHTLLPEALEKWPLGWFETLLPRHLEIIFEINRRLLDDVRQRFPGDEGRIARTSLIEEGPAKHVRMANLAIVGSHSTNGAAAIHSALLRTTTVKDLSDMCPERFSNKTNGSLRVDGCCWRTRRTPISSRRRSATAGSPTSASWRGSSRAPTIVDAAMLSALRRPMSSCSRRGFARESCRCRRGRSSTFGWERYVGDAGRVIGIKTFGASAPLKALQQKFGFEPDRVAAAARELVGKP